MKTWKLTDPPGPEVRFIHTADGRIMEREQLDGMVWRYWSKYQPKGTYGTTRPWHQILSWGEVTDATAEVEADLAKSDRS